MFRLEQQRWEERLEEEDVSCFLSWKHADVPCGKTNGIIRGQSQLRRGKEARARNCSRRKRAYCGLTEIFKVNPASDTLVKIRPRMAEETVEVRGCSGKREQWDRWWRRGPDGDISSEGGKASLCQAGLPPKFADINRWAETAMWNMLTRGVTQSKLIPIKGWTGKVGEIPKHAGED